MKRLVLVLALPGLLLWIVDAAYVLLPGQVAQQLPLSSFRAVPAFGVPLLGLVTGICAALYAGQRTDSRWVIFFAIVAMLSVVLVGVGLFSVLFLLLSFNPARQAIGGPLANVCLLFPIVVFVAALVYALRRDSQGGKP